MLGQARRRRKRQNEIRREGRAEKIRERESRRAHHSEFSARRAQRSRAQRRRRLELNAASALHVSRHARSRRVCRSRTRGTRRPQHPRVQSRRQPASRPHPARVAGPASPVRHRYLARQNGIAPRESRLRCQLRRHLQRPKVYRPSRIRSQKTGKVRRPLKRASASVYAGGPFLLRRTPREG